MSLYCRSFFIDGLHFLGKARVKKWSYTCIIINNNKSTVCDFMINSRRLSLLRYQNNRVRNKIINRTMSSSSSQSELEIYVSKIV